MAFGKMVIDLEETTKSKYYAARNEKQCVFGERPNGFVYREEQGKFLLYLTNRGKFYVGPMGDYLYTDFQKMNLREIVVTYTAVFEDPAWQEGKPAPVVANNNGGKPAA